MTSFIQSTWLAGLRGRSFHLVLMLGLILVGWAFLASFFSPRHPQTVALDVGISGIRITLVLLSLFWVQELVSKEIERRTLVLTMAHPVSRMDYIIGRYAGISVLLLVSTIILALLLLLTVFATEGEYGAARKVSLGIPYWATMIGLWLDVLVVTSFTLCIASLSTMVFLPFAVGIMFTLAARSLGIVLEFLFVRQAEGDQALLFQFGPVIKSIRWMLPDLSRLDWRDWTLYGLSPDTDSLIMAIVMAVAYSVILLSLAVFCFQRRELV
jgi:ABC-type transport system involved in multi-copper enzyme maturation permease subunit